MGFNSAGNATITEPHFASEEHFKFPTELLRKISGIDELTFTNAEFCFNFAIIDSFDFVFSLNLLKSRTSLWQRPHRIEAVSVI